MGEKLTVGDTFPDMSFDLVGGGTLNLPGDLEGPYNIILFYRGVF